MEHESLECDQYQAFLQSFNNVIQNPTDQNSWNTATILGLKWTVTRVQSDLAPLGPDSGYGHLFCDKGLRAGQLKMNQQSPALERDQRLEMGAFLLRLISMKPKGLVQIWRETYQACITNCVDCVVEHDASLSRLEEKSVAIISISVPSKHHS
jgi:hypothetical protein